MPRWPSTPPTRSRRCCGWWPSRHASSWAPTAAWRRWRRPASPDRRSGLLRPGRQALDGVRQWLDLFAIYRVIRLSGGSVRMAGEQLAALPPFRSAVGNRPLQGWLAASLTALDGSELGAIQLFDKQDGGFTERRRGRRSSISPRWRRRPSSEHGSTRSTVSPQLRDRRLDTRPDSLGDALKRLDGLCHRLDRFLQLLHVGQILGHGLRFWPPAISSFAWSSRTSPVRVSAVRLRAGAGGPVRRPLRAGAACERWMRQASVGPGGPALVAPPGALASPLGRSRRGPRRRHPCAQVGQGGGEC